MARRTQLTTEQQVKVMTMKAAGMTIQAIADDMGLSYYMVARNLPKAPRGRPKHKPTEKDRQAVKAMSGYGLTDGQIASVVGVDVTTLTRHYAEELTEGSAMAIANVARTLYQQATHKTKPNVSAAIFYLKCKAGWQEKPVATTKEAKTKTTEEDKWGALL